MKKNKFILFVGCFLLGISLLACQSFPWRVSENLLSQFDGDTIIPQNATTIKLVFEKQISQTEGIFFLNKLQQNLFLSGRLSPVENNPDLLLTMQFLHPNDEIVQVDRAGIPVKKRLYLTVVFSLYNMQKKEYIFFQQEVSAFQEYSEIRMPVKNAIIVQQELEQILAERLAVKIEKGWFTELQKPIERRQ